MTTAYTHGHHGSVLRSHRWRTAENSAAYLLDQLAKPQRLLDVGCGPGTITVELAQHVGEVTAIDSAELAVSETRALAKQRGQSNVEAEVADINALRYPGESFDVVHAHQVLQHLVDPVAALREMRRVCRPGGIVAARDADYAAMAWYPQLPQLDEWLALYRRVARGNGGEPDAGRRMRAWARAAGFTQFETTGSVWCFASPADRQWWSSMWAERIIESAVATAALDAGYATATDLERLSQGWRDWGADPDGWFCIVHGEIVCKA